MKTHFKNGKLGIKYVLVEENFLNLIDSKLHADAYVGEHTGGYAEIEFAGKYLDACVLFYQNSVNKAFLDRAKTVVDSICENQRSDGYLGGMSKGMEWVSFSVWNQAFTVLGLVSYFKVTSEQRALVAAEKCIRYIANHYMYEGGDILDGNNNGSQHLSILPAVAALYQVSSQKIYRDFMVHITDAMKHSDNNFFSFGSILELRSKKGIENFVILLGMLAYGESCSDPGALASCEKYWTELQDTQIRETGNGTIEENWTVGGNEAKFLGYDSRPNENCVAVGWFELSNALFKRTKKTYYLDAMEKTLYNHILGSMDGKCSDFGYYQPNYGIKYTNSEKNAVYKCCRYRGYHVFSQLPGCLFDEDSKYITPMLYTDCLYEGETVTVEERTGYPYDGVIAFHIKGKTDKKLRLRIPGWCKSFSITKNENGLDCDMEDGYICISVGENDEIVLKLEQSLCFTGVKIEDANYVYATYGCILLAIDSNLNQDIYNIVLDTESACAWVKQPAHYDIGFCVNGFLNEEKIDVHLVDFASAGKVLENSEYTIYVKAR